MKRLVPYIFLQVMLAALMGCAALRSTGRSETRTAYQVTLLIAEPDNAEIHGVLVSVPHIHLTSFPHLPVISSTGTPYQEYELQLESRGSVQALKAALLNAGIPVANLQVKEVNL